MIIKITYKVELKDVILEFFFILFIEMSFQAIISAVIDKFIYDDDIKIITVELVTLVSIIIFSKINLSKIVTFKRINTNIAMYMISTFGMEVIIFKLILIYYNTIILDNLSIISIIVIIFTSFQVLTYVKIVRSTKEHETLKILNQYNNVIDEIVEEIKQRQHDFVNYKNTIRGIVEVVDKDKIGEEIRNYIKDEDIYDTKINELIYIDNAIIRCVIYRNICKAKKHNINFQYRIDNNVLDNIFNYNELSNLLNNLLNNAFEEVMKDDCIRKNIEINIFSKDKTSHLMVKNQIADSNNINLNEMLTRGYSTKNIDTRGYGLSNVEQIIKSHNGRMEIKMESKEIIFNIYFNNSLG